ncbi:hypothetical protein cypCar_00022126 [Cyprinus carpio]|nr:hypothetical protein cypCar_00022126 [Cyprinus carpio]
MLWVTLLSTIALGWMTPIPLLDDSEEIDEPCFEPCYCEVKEGLFHVHCDSKGFTNISQVSQSWLRPFKLYLQKNSLRKLYFNSFLHLNNAVAINLGNNALQDIHVGAFNGLSSLKRLYLHENKLEVFRNDTFLGLESLEYLQADYNVIKRIDSGAFRNLHKLRVLILNDNLIPMLPAFLFRSVSLTHLDLRGNRLKTLTYKGILEYIGRSLMEIQLEENPWNCVCDIIQLQAWLERIPYTAVVGEITCEYPFHLHGKDLREIKRSELCPLLNEAEIESILGILHLPFYTGRARPTKPSSIVSPNQNTVSSVEQRERPPKPTKRPRPSKTPPTPRSVFPNQPPVAGYQTRPPIPIICPIGCTCNLHINDLGLTVNFSGVLEHLHAVVQIDLNQNPWDCSCDIIPLKEWLDTLSLVVIVGEVVCKTPELVSGKDLRSLNSEVICPELRQSSLSPAESDSRLITTYPEVGPHPPKGAIPLSVLILSLLVLFVSAFFAAAALCAYALKKREKLPFRKQGEVGLAGIQMECGIFTEQPPTLPETPPSNHVYDSIGAPSSHMCSNPVYKSGQESGQKHTFTETKESGSHYRTLVEKEKEWTMAISSSPINTIVTVGAPCGDISSFHENGILCPTVIDSQGPTPKVGLVDSLFGTTSQFSNLSDRHTHPPSEYPHAKQDVRQKQMITTTTGTRTGCPNQTQSDYPELRARLKTKMDYIDMLERSYQF